MEPKPIVRRLVKTTVLARSDVADVSDDHALLDSGLMDSMGIFELVSALEQECGVRVEDDELIPENFNSIDAITALLETKSPS